MPTFTPPTRDSVAWSGESPLWRHYGAVRAGITIYKDAFGNWNMMEEGYDESILLTANPVYRGGREYDITLAAYNDVVVWLISQGFTDYDPDVYPGFYPGPIRFLGAEAYPGVPV